MSFEEPRLDSRPNATIVLLVAFVEIYREQDLKRAGVVLEKKRKQNAGPGGCVGPAHGRK